MSEAYCDVCNNIFKKRHPNQKRCSKECMQVAFGLYQEEYRLNGKRKKTAQKKKTEKKSKFTPVNEFIKQHYEETGELLSYGKAVVLMERKKKR
jgi:hypothetical protein